MTPQVFVLTAYLTIAWGTYFAIAVRDYVRARATVHRRRDETVKVWRRMVVAFCLFMLPFSFFLRAGLTLLSLENTTISGIVFFSIAGTNVAGSIFCLVSLRYD